MGDQSSASIQSNGGNEALRIGVAYPEQSLSCYPVQMALRFCTDKFVSERRCCGSGLDQLSRSIDLFGLDPLDLKLC